ncbi:hypothetical protein KRX56_04390 [Dermabacteraceae bacterium TAE3-ERU27]|nr:hypothetical protein [Dermabacteraceae bacterium TAE3-ERU27]
MPKTYEVPPAPPANHGSTLAAWVLTWGVVIGSVVAAVGFSLDIDFATYGGVAIIVLTCAASLGLRAAGFGQKTKKA